VNRGRLLGILGPHAERASGAILTRLRHRLPASRDDRPWRHPFLNGRNIARFRAYSEAVWQDAFERSKYLPEDLRIAFSVNMAQNMYKWACLAADAGFDAHLFLEPQDRSALSLPQWEEFDGEWSDPLDGDAFRRQHGGIAVRVPVHEPPLSDSGFSKARAAWWHDRRRLHRLRSAAPGLRFEALQTHPAYAAYVATAQALSSFHVIHAASLPLGAYLSGRPYCVTSVGGDLQIDCGRSDQHGILLAAAFSSARYIFVTNPHTLGHCRRLGFTNGVYMPYPMDEDRYTLGPGLARRNWEARVGPGFFVLCPSRIDPAAKGQSREMLEALVRSANRHTNLRFVFLRWGAGLRAFEEQLAEVVGRDRFLLLPAVGKKRLIDYYRSCDAVLDSLVYGYYGATTLEAAAVGRPVVMRVRNEHYRPLYHGEPAPVHAVDSPDELERTLGALAAAPEAANASGRRLRDWLIRHHGRERTVALLTALLASAADGSVAPPPADNPLLDPETAEEAAYHLSCLGPPT